MPPASAIEVIILPALAVFFGWLVYLLGVRMERVTHEPARWKWVGVVILILGAYAGFGPFLSYVSPGLDAQLYRDSIPGRRMLISHLSGFLVPLVSVVLVALYEFWWKRRPIREED
jgi:hypothetical protein